ncbi:MAG TPA: hypothetical protein VG245_04585 [Candidatus Dormibacteraeota bacterium]|jgi:hypothetical protein|nr:hypothetical protein [Candidatus Dormibacteraeota bacterium]
MIRSSWIRSSALVGTMLLGLVPLAAHASGGGPVATFTSRYVAGTIETDPVAGEAVGILNCNVNVPDVAGLLSGTLGGACFDLSAYAGLSEITQVIPDGITDTSTTTLFQGYDLNGDHCVSCFAGDGDQASESGTNGVVGESIPSFAGPLQVFVRLVSVHDGLVLHHSLTGTVRVTVVNPADFGPDCAGTEGGCGGPFVFPTVCTSTGIQGLTQGVLTGAVAGAGDPCGGGICVDRAIVVPNPSIGCVRDFPLPYPYPGT